MLTELNRFNSFGRINDFKLILGELLSEKPVRIDNVIKFCMGAQDYYNTPVSAILWILNDLKLLTLKLDKVALTSEGKEVQVLFKSNIPEGINLLLDKVVSNYFLKMISIDAVKFDLHEETYYFSNNDIDYKLSGIRNLLINFKFMRYDKNSINIYIDKEYVLLFELVIKKSSSKLTYEKFLEIQKQKELLGQQAEEFVLNYERTKLKELGSLLYRKIKRVSVTDVSAGYDILSFLNEKSLNYDKYIEVKSYSQKPNFFWSKNEVEVAKENKLNYFLYLIDRSKIGEENYSPIIIQNPYDNIFIKDQWEKEAQSWKFSFKEK